MFLCVGRMGFWSSRPLPQIETVFRSIFQILLEQGLRLVSLVLWRLIHRRNVRTAGGLFLWELASFGSHLRNGFATCRMGPTSFFRATAAHRANTRHDECSCRAVKRGTCFKVYSLFSFVSTFADSSWTSQDREITNVLMTSGSSSGINVAQAHDMINNKISGPKQILVMSGAWSACCSKRAAPLSALESQNMTDAGWRWRCPVLAGVCERDEW